jgi:hypothetical protein
MSNGRVYEGGFRNDKRSGWGVFRWPGGQNAGDTYVGGMCGAVAICFAVLNDQSQSLLCSEWRDSKRHGQGTYTWADGRVYQGEWCNDKRAGGKSTYPGMRIAATSQTAVQVLLAFAHGFH